MMTDENLSVLTNHNRITGAIHRDDITGLQNLCKGKFPELLPEPERQIDNRFISETRAIRECMYGKTCIRSPKRSDKLYVVLMKAYIQLLMSLVNFLFARRNAY